MRNKKLGAVVLAGGQASRLGYVDKPLLCLNGKEIIAYVIDKASLDASKIVISVNRNPERFSKFNLPLVNDNPYEPFGPLLGIYSAMAWFKSQAVEIKYLACFPADVPLFPDHIANRLLAALLGDNSMIAWCQSKAQIQPLFSVWSMDIFAELEQAVEDGVKGPKLFIPLHPNSLVTIDSGSAADFFNINTGADLEEAEKLVANHRLSPGHQS